MHADLVIKSILGHLRRRYSARALHGNAVAVSRKLCYTFLVWHAILTMPGVDRPTSTAMSAARNTTSAPRKSSRMPSHLNKNKTRVRWEDYTVWTENHPIKLVTLGV